MRPAATAVAALALASLVAAPAAGAASARDRPDTPGPLDLVKVEVGQKETKLKVRIGVSSPLPLKSILANAYAAIVPKMTLRMATHRATIKLFRKK